MNTWIEFYSEFFQSRSEAISFVERIENIAADNPIHPSRIIMHQTQRLISLADDMPKIRPQRESLQLIFLMICAENVSKLHANFNGDGLSKAYTKRFFMEILPEEPRECFRRCFMRDDWSAMTVDQVVSALYEVRCDVVHEGKYWGFNLPKEGRQMLNQAPDLIVRASYQDLRRFVVLGCIEAIQTYSPSNLPIKSK
ncbi:MAG TPA: hypothetical protein VFW49_11485 [Fluviicoccus sp.]|nr:hypothetical protein [Fluviicoccus sp.]